MDKINITNAVNLGKLTIDKIICYYANNFVPSYLAKVKSLEYKYYPDIEVTPCYVSREEENNEQPGKVYMFGGLTFDDKLYEYSSTQTELLGLCVPEPQNAGGAKGVKVKLVNRNIFFVSGELTGCSVAVLHNEQNEYFFIHSGSNNPNNLDHNQRNGLIWRDLYNCCTCLINREYLFTKEIMSLNELLDGLSYLGLFGTIIAPKSCINDYRVYISKDGRFTVNRYLNEDNKKEGYSITHSVIAAVNTEGIFSVGMRRIRKYVLQNKCEVLNVYIS